MEGVWRRVRRRAWLLGVVIAVVGLARGVNVSVAQSHSVGVVEAFTPIAAAVTVAGLAVVVIGLAVRA